MLTPVEVNAALETMWPGARCACVEVTREVAVSELSVTPDDLRPGGFVSGPTLFAAADAALWFLAFGVAERVQPLALTSDLAIRFLRPARGRVVRARATLERATRRTVIGTVRVWMDDDQESTCATAQGTYVAPDAG
ncbi:MAG: PaaI family thioesterase [Planctomycetota bacterium]